MAEFLDSHAHLASEAFDPDRGDVISRAREAGATAVICIGESLDAASRASGIAAANRGFVWHTAGIHPHDAADFDAARDIPGIREHVVEHGAVAVGECGLDYHYDHSPREQQRRALDAQLALAAELNAPIVLHTREAEPDTRAMLQGAGSAGIRGVLHCYTGSAELAVTGLQAGWYVSFSGIITFRKWTDLELLRMVPADRILVESDSPYLAPVPNRGKRNEPAWVSHTLARLAEVRGVPVDELGRQVVGNARDLFGLAMPPAGGLD
ncbi:MAG TPA: TatD family hydrolase [Gemmatimonadales bacterium]|nr:TatD family hydrolase [Gemmatimonadales bacterium]